MNTSPDTYQLNQNEIAFSKQCFSYALIDYSRAHLGKARGNFHFNQTSMEAQSILVLLKEFGDLPQASHLNIPDFKRVIDVIKQCGYAAKEIIRILNLPDMYVAFAKHVQYPRALSLERLYKAFYQSEIHQRTRKNFTS